MSPIRLSVLLVACVVAACGSPEQTEECRKYVECSRALQPENSKIYEDTYGASGICWNDGTTAETCEDVCPQELQKLKAAHPDVAACQ